MARGWGHQKESQPLVRQVSFVPVPAGTRPSGFFWNRCCIPLTSDLKILDVLGCQQHGESCRDLGTLCRVQAQDGAFYFGLLTFVQTTIDYGDLGSWNKCTFYYAMFRYFPQTLIYIDKPMTNKEWNVMFYICLSQGVALLGVWPFWSRYVTVVLDFNTLSLASWKWVYC